MSDIFSYTDNDIDNLVNTVNEDKVKYCEACGKPFALVNGITKRFKYCKRNHYSICSVCGKAFDIDLSVGIKLINKTCSPECSKILTSKSLKDYKNSTVIVSKPKRFKTNICCFCGKEFQSEQPKKYCSSDCRREARKIHFQSTTRKCKLCGKSFHPVNTRNWYCDGPHYRYCPVCGKKILMSNPSEPDYACSNECKQILRKQTSMKKYGVSNPAQYHETKNKIRDSAISAEPKKQRKLFETYGVTNVAQIPEVRDKISKTVRSEECKKRTESTNLERYGVEYAMHNRDLVIKQTYSAYHSITDDGTRVDSSYEKDVYNFCLRNNLKFETQVPIEYEYKGKKHVTFIDFKIEDIFFECKGGHLLNGCFNYGNIVPIETKIELYKKHHVIVVTDKNGSSVFGKPNSEESNGLKYSDKCKYPLIGVDISLFNNPSFPYRDDRPHLFYTVKVNGQRSSFEAFQDESIRWKMIINRIMYSGGFIDSNQVLQAMNISRVCKQPSWFSKSFAKRLINDYCTSQVIVDPFAGWGMRHDAAIECRRKYIGCDLNEGLVDWHRAKHRNIFLGDAKEFRYEKECSVLICPPYQDIEMYFDDQDIGLTQCEWLSVVMKNVPNAKEYVMVCKIVDVGWEKYVVDTKVNRSHYGKNNEYILVVKDNN